MNTAKNILLFFASFLVMGFLVLLIDQIFPNNSTDFQAYSKRSEILMNLNK